jgi:hypothetical protein
LILQSFFGCHQGIEVRGVDWMLTIDGLQLLTTETRFNKDIRDWRGSFNNMEIDNEAS